MTQNDVKEMFKYHPANADQTQKYEKIRKAGEELAMAILDSTPPRCEQDDAINHVLHAVMAANAAIARYGK
jgi:hypothetical protein